MNDAGSTTPVPTDVDLRLAFFKKLQEVTTKIHATNNLDEIMLDLGMEFCDLFNCDRFTLYAMDHEKDYIVSKVKTGLTTFRDLKLAVTPASIAGYVAQTRKTINIADVYDEAELARLSPELRFQRGVVQFINNRAGGPFSAVCEDGVKQLCETLSVAFSQRLKPPQLVRSKYDGLVADAVLSAQEMELATRSARKKECDIEEVLLDEFQVKLAAIGQSLAKFFSVPYEPFKPDRIKPVDLLKNLKRSYIEECGWLPLEDNKDGLAVVALDPERVCQTHIVSQIFPKAKAAYRVTSQREFRQMVDQFFGAASESGSVGDLLDRKSSCRERV